MRHPLSLGVTAAIVLLAGGCGSSSKTATNAAAPAASTAAQTTTQASTSAPSTASAPTTAPAGLLVSDKHDKLGAILAAGPKKLTVYLFEADKGSASSCSGACAHVWPPVTTAVSATAGGSASSADLGTITRADGTKQVTYKGHPLYYYAKDKDSGDAYGQGVKSFGAPWYVLSPSGSKVDKS